jgi:hypothetical protein
MPCARGAGNDACEDVARARRCEPPWRRSVDRGPADGRAPDALGRTTHSASYDRTAEDLK